jgi:hypothetical protein
MTDLMERPAVDPSHELPEGDEFLLPAEFDEDGPDLEIDEPGDEERRAEADATAAEAHVDRSAAIGKFANNVIDDPEDE